MTWPDSTNENFKNCSTFDPSVDELVFYNKRIFYESIPTVYELNFRGIRCAIIFDIVYPCAIAIFLCPFAVYFFLPFAKTPSFIPILNFILSFGLSTSGLIQKNFQSEKNSILKKILFCKLLSRQLSAIIFLIKKSAGTIFYLLIPSCLENPIDIPTEAQGIR